MIHSSPAYSLGDVTGLVLAGGASRRMGQTDKFLLPLGDIRIIDHVIDKAKPQVGTLLISANGNPLRLNLPDHKILADKYNDGGPIAGLLAAMDHLGQCSPWLMTFPADTPFVSSTLVADLLKEAEATDQVLCPRVHGQSQYAMALWSTHHSVTDYLKLAFAEGVRSLRGAISELDCRIVEFNTKDEKPDEPDSPMQFFNINTPADLARAQHYWRAHFARD